MKDKGFIRFLKRCPLAVMLIVSIVLVTVISFCQTVWGRYQFRISMDHTLLSSVVLKEYKTRPQAKEKESGTGKKKIIVQEKKGKIQTKTDTTAQKQDTKSVEKGIPTEYKKQKSTHVKSPYYGDPGKIALTTKYPYITVDHSYYKDALFIGDSRVEGLQQYSGLKEATFYAKEGLTVYEMMKKKIVSAGAGRKISVTQALQKKKFRKIYIMIGINELGLKTTKDYAAQYRKNLKKIHRLQPDAKIFIMGIMHVTTKYSASSKVFNNTNINDKNVAVAGFANGMDTFYLDMNPAVVDASGGVRAKYTWDGIHLKAEYYSRWVDFLNKHGLPQEAFASEK